MRFQVLVVYSLLFAKCLMQRPIGSLVFATLFFFVSLGRKVSSGRTQYRTPRQPLQTGKSGEPGGLSMRQCIQLRGAFLLHITLSEADWTLNTVSRIMINL